MMKKILLFLICLNASAQLPKLKVSDNGRFLQTEKGSPFFWTADTAWELFHKLNKEEAAVYLTKRAAQGFNVVQAVVLAELDGINTPNAYGHTPFLDLHTLKPNPKYFDHVAYVIKKADSLGIYMAVLPTWGDKIFKDKWGEGPEIFNETNAKTYASWLALRFRPHDNIVWVLGGDRRPRDGSKDTAIWRAMADGLQEGSGVFKRDLITFHPQPDSPGGSSNWFHKDNWLSFNMHQTGHCADQPVFQKIQHDYNLSPAKPTIDGEPLYEDHPNCFNAKEKGYSAAEDIRRIMYANVFAGAAGQTYGCHDVWQMYKVGEQGVNGPLRPWNLALDLPMANQMKHLKNLLLSRPYFDRIPDQSMIESTQELSIDNVMATRQELGTYAMVYFPLGQTAAINTSKLTGAVLNAWWYDPRTGASFMAGQLQNFGSFNATPPSSGKGNDWVLVLDDAKSDHTKPGQSRY